jgi:hypothetical protein
MILNHRRRARPMIAAIDTNILLDILLPNEEFVDAAVRALENSATETRSAWKLQAAKRISQASRLLSRDRGFYRKLFPKLSLLDPSVT